MATVRCGVSEVGGRTVVRVYVTVGVTTLSLGVDEAERLAAEFPRAVARARSALAAARAKPKPKPAGGAASVLDRAG